MRISIISTEEIAPAPQGLPLEQWSKEHCLAWLLKQSIQNKDLSCDRVVFLEGGALTQAQEIGRRLHGIGGFTAMQATATCYQQVLAQYYPERSSDARALDFAWDGVGEWMA